MILTVDIGNTNIAIGGFLKDQLAFVARICTDTTKTADEYADKILGILRLYKIESDLVEGAIIASVVPPLTVVLKDALKVAYGVDTEIVSCERDCKMQLLCDQPSTVGADIICACVAAKYVYGYPSLIVDMGTATKMMVIDKNGDFIGVSIMPGVLMGLKALSSNTAQLPQVSLEAPLSVIGKNTADCMKSGAVYGNACMVDGMIDRFNEEYGKKLNVYATGGLAPYIVKHLKHEVTLDENLVLKGLNLLYSKNS